MITNSTTAIRQSCLVIITTPSSIMLVSSCSPCACFMRVYALLVPLAPYSCHATSLLLTFSVQSACRPFCWQGTWHAVERDALPQERHHACILSIRPIAFRHAGVRHADSRRWAWAGCSPTHQAQNRHVSDCAYLATFHILHVAGNGTLESQEHGRMELMENGTQVSINIPKSWESRLGELVIIASVPDEEPIVFRDFANDGNNGQD